MPLPLIAAGMSLVGGIGKVIQGIRQRKAAKKLEKSNFIPASMQESVNRLRANASSTMMPGYTQAVENIQQGTSNNIRAAGAGSISDKLSAAQGGNVAQNDAIVDVQTKGAAFQLKNEDRLNTGLMERSRMEEKNEDTFRTTKQTMLNSASQNIFGGLTDISSMGAGASAGAFGGGGVNKLLKMDPKVVNEAVSKGQIDLEEYSPAERIKISQHLNSQ